MRLLKGLILSGALIVATASATEAQFSLAIGNPYGGQGVYVGTPAYGGGFGYPAYGISPYATGLGYTGVGGYYPRYATGFARPYNPGYVGGYGYSSGYRGVAPVVGGYGYGYGGRPYNGGYGFGGNGFRGNRPFGRFIR